MCALIGALLAATLLAAEASLPDARGLLDRLLANQDKVDELREGYTYKDHEREYSLKRDKGEIRAKLEHDSLWQVYPSRKLLVRRRLEKDGRALDAEAARKEDERIAKFYRKDAERQRQREQQGKADEDDDNVKLQDLLRASTLTTIGRESVDGRSCLIVEIRGNPDYKAQSQAEKLAQHLEGRLWVDEEDLQVARAEARLSKLKIAGGLVASLKEARLVFEQKRVNDEIWLPTRAEAEHQGRLFLLKGFNGRSTDEFSDYEKFSTGVEVSYGDPLPPTPPNSAESSAR